METSEPRAKGPSSSGGGRLGAVKKLRRCGIRVATREAFPALASAVDEWPDTDTRKGFDDQLAALFLAALTPYAANAFAKIANEVLCLDTKTRSMSPTEARNHSVQRLRGTTTPQAVGAFSKNEQVKALDLLDHAIGELLATPASRDSQTGALAPELVQALVEARVNRFFSSRDGYRKYRDSRDTISQYVSQANESIEMVSISLATGHDMEQVADAFETAILRHRQPVRVVVSLLDPDLDYLLQSIAPVLGFSSTSLSQRINDTIASLVELRQERLPRNKRGYLEVWCHRVLANASAIILDADGEAGRVQLETKGFRTGMGKSWGFEVLSGSEFFMTLRDSYRSLIQDGRRVI